MTEEMPLDRQQTAERTRQWLNRAPDPQTIEEDPEVDRDPLIMELRRAFGSGENASHLLKGREH